MKDYFIHDYPCLQLSKYFMRFIDKMCNKLNFYVYYNPQQNNFIVSDSILKHSSSSYKTLEQIKLDKPVSIFSSEEYNWSRKKLILFNKEHSYEQNDGEWYYPDHYESNHDIDFQMSTPNLQKLLLCIFKNPILQSEYRQIQEIFSTHDISLFFPSESLSVNENLDFLLIKNLEQRCLIEQIIKKNNPDLINILKKKSENYLIEFFNSFGVIGDLKFKDFIFEITSNENTLEKIFEKLPDFQKFLKKNNSHDFLTKKTESISISKTYFNITNLSVNYHEKFNEIETKSCLLNVIGNYALKQELAQKNIHVHSSFYDYTEKAVILIIENNSIMPIEKIEQFFCESLNYIVKNNNNDYMDNSKDNNKENILKFFHYFYQNELSLLALADKSHIKKSIKKI